MFVCVSVCVIACHCVRRSFGVIVWVTLCMSLHVTSRALGSIKLSHIGSKPCSNAVKKDARVENLHIYLHVYLHFLDFYLARNINNEILSYKDFV